MKLKLNCDLGENAALDGHAVDEVVMPHIDQANIACGFHAGGPAVMRHTLALAAQYDVQIGAHPGYPDPEGFGRRSMACSTAEIVAFMHYQMAALEGMARSQGLELEYVKPHGALYNDMMAKLNVREAVFEAIASYHKPLPLMIQSTMAADEHRHEAQKHGITLWLEAFADRCYDDDGTLLARDRPEAVHTREKMLAQVEQLKSEATITTLNGHVLALDVDSLCVHGDNAESVAVIQLIRELMARED